MRKMVNVLGILTLSFLVAQFAWAGGGLLLVDDDGSSVPETTYTDVRPVFEAALQEARLVPVLNATIRGEYEVYEVSTISADGPSLAKLDDYEAVIWFTGEVRSTLLNSCLTANDEANLAAYLDLGGRLFLSSQDYLHFFGDGSLSPGDFPYDYLKVEACTMDVWEGPGWIAETPDAPGPISWGLIFELENPFTAGTGDIEVDKLVSQTPANGIIADEFEIDDIVAGTGYTGVSYKEGAMPGDYITFFSTISFAALRTMVLDISILTGSSSGWGTILIWSSTPGRWTMIFTTTELSSIFRIRRAA